MQAHHLLVASKEILKEKQQRWAWIKGRHFNRLFKINLLL